jgi:3-phosphoshikimate 1-carboxyvinyltransferase
MGFFYEGALGASKSLLNRALILQSYFPELRIDGESACDDVADLKENLSQIGKTNLFKLNEGGTTLRFLVMRLSREAGEFKIQASRRLLERPQDELFNLLEQVGVRATKSVDQITLKGEGWRLIPHSLGVSRSRSSQFLSSLILNSPKLSGPLSIETSGPEMSEDYLKMTLKVCGSLGLTYERSGASLQLKPWSQLTSTTIEVGADLSSVFPLACMASLSGDLKVTNVKSMELQPDHQFIALFKKMGIPVSLVGTTLQVSQAEIRQGVSVSLQDCPDLFPVLSCLCALAESPSRLTGAPQLKFKESDRLQKVFELFDRARISYKPLSDGIEIVGLARPHSAEFEFDPDHDHRMAMAAAFLKMAGWKIHIKDPNVVSKSFPEFWQITGVQP